MLSLDISLLIKIYVLSSPLLPSIRTHAPRDARGHIALLQHERRATQRARPGNLLHARTLGGLPRDPF